MHSTRRASSPKTPCSIGSKSQQWRQATELHCLLKQKPLPVRLHGITTMCQGARNNSHTKAAVASASYCFCLSHGSKCKTRGRLRVVANLQSPLPPWSTRARLPSPSLLSSHLSISSFSSFPFPLVGLITRPSNFILVPRSSIAPSSLLHHSTSWVTHTKARAALASLKQCRRSRTQSRACCH